MRASLFRAHAFSPSSEWLERLPFCKKGGSQPDFRLRHQEQDGKTLFDKTPKGVKKAPNDPALKPLKAFRTNYGGLPDTILRKGFAASQSPPQKSEQELALAAQAQTLDQ